MTAPIPRDIPELPAIPRTHALIPSYVPAAAVVAPVRRPLVGVFRLLIAALAATTVALTLLLGSPVRVLSHFAVQSTILLALVTAASARRAWTARKPLPSALTGAALLYVVITALVDHLLLADTTPPFSVTTPGTASTGWHHLLTDVLLHTVVPAAAVLDWLLLTAPGTLRLRQAASWLVYPVAYLAFTLARGALDMPGTVAAKGEAGTRYFYPFLDVAAHGYRHVLANALLLGLAFYALALVLVALDHTRPNPTRHRTKTGFRLQPPVG
ncbi:Pr6Pr family membrane protein [Streptomyces galbus]|uniref:Integral membrane regulator n=1 Tax=Streptomyces galbus TaxID=33898 RepID=A0A4U5WZA2_STRGB|nr:Pr6Pr family membrane protein [Streptomyces galbus]TKT06286.1 integral membrane regulator [Streptomyces galbus]GHD47427.1 integral membrane regulator [Streptomyces galbus]